MRKRQWVRLDILSIPVALTSHLRSVVILKATSYCWQEEKCETVETVWRFLKNLEIELPYMIQ